MSKWSSDTMFSGKCLAVKRCQIVATFVACAQLCWQVINNFSHNGTFQTCQQVISSPTLYLQPTKALVFFITFLYSINSVICRPSDFTEGRPRTEIRTLSYCTVIFWAVYPELVYKSRVGLQVVQSVMSANDTLGHWNVCMWLVCHVSLSETVD